MRLLYKEDPRILALQSESHTLVFRQTPGSKPAVAIELVENSRVSKSSGYSALLPRDVFGCLGLIRIDGEVFLAVITGAVVSVARPLRYESVDKIYAVEFVSLTKDTWDFTNLDSVPGSGEDTPYAEIHPCMDLRKLLSNGSFYYSNDFDLTSLLQNRGIDQLQLRQRDRRRKINLEHYSEEYMWNSFMMKELIKAHSNFDPAVQEIMDSNRFLTTVIRGFAKTVPLTKTDKITIISKQSWKRAGTRFNARGIDDDGNVANFVETEFIYDQVSKDAIFAFTQIRGSVPAFWEQDSTLINPKITVTRSVDATQPMFNSHFQYICTKYGPCHILNLLSKTKSQEVAVSNRYKQLFNSAANKDELVYTEFDFHHETKQSGGFSGATKILPLLFNSLEQFGWFSYDSQQGEVITRQDGVFRVNCLDCLDRTNLIEQVVCQSVFDNIVNNSTGPRDRMRSEEDVYKYNSLWADNGDAISQIYTGTNALKSSFSRSGKMNLAGALSDVTKSVSRMYQNTFVDNKKQSTMDLLLGYDSKNAKAVKIYDPVNEFVQEKLKAQESTFTTYDDITIFTGTFNVNATLPSRNTDLTPWLFPAHNTVLPDIYAIGFQELIELNAGSILNADSSRPAKWAELIESQLNSQNEQYVLLRTESIASMSLFLFIKKARMQFVTQVAGSSKKTGLGGMTANKGGCAVRFDYGSTSFALITSHLAAGSSATVERYNDYSTIMSGLTFVRNMNIIDHDHIIWFGDLNYRVNLMNDHCRSLIGEEKFDEMLEYDQLRQEMSSSKGAFSGFSEGAVRFMPTYKFDKGTSTYDSSEKQRVPSWTDRILYRSARGCPKLSQLNYNSLMEVMISDHKPVYSSFEANVKLVDHQRKMSLYKSLYESYKKSHGDATDSILDFSDNSSGSSSTAPTSFRADTMSELNLMDTFDTPPPQPKRPVTSATLPRRVPPPPAARRANELDLTANRASTLPRKLPPRFDENGAQSATPSPQPPPPRSTASMPVGWSSTPLIPSRSNTATPKSPSPVNGRSATPKAQVQPPAKVAPMVPSKPTALAAHKINEPTPTSEAPQASGPAPPPPRNTTPARTMSDWKPLVPK